MRALTKFASLVAILGAATVLHAQTPAPGAGAPAETAATASTSSDLSIEEMQTGAVKFETQVKADMAQVLHLRELARKKKDIIKLNCVNDRLVQLKAQVNLFETAYQQLQLALVRKGEERKALYLDLTVSAEGVKRLREEAATCVGEPELFKQESGVEVTRPDLPDDPVTDNPFDEPTGTGTELEPPGYASPFY